MNYLETIKNITKDKEKRTQNLVLLVILLVILLISINLIFDKNSNNESNITKKAESDGSNRFGEKIRKYFVTNIWNK